MSDIAKLKLSNKEIFNDDESIKYFTLKNIGKSPSKLDFDRIKSINEHYIKNLDKKILADNLISYVKTYKNILKDEVSTKIIENIDILKNKAKTLEDIYNNSAFIFKYKKIEGAINETNKIFIIKFRDEVSKLKSYDNEKISEINETIIKENNIKFKDLGQPLRLILTGSSQAPSITDIIKILGLSETINRINSHIN